MPRATPSTPSVWTLPRKIPALTGIRGLAAVWVILFHFGPELEKFLPGVRHAQWLWGQGDAAVPLFYLLSGFILSHIYDPLVFPLRPRALATFFKHRLFRVYPLYLFTLLAFAATVLLTWPPDPEYHDVYTARVFVLNLLLVENFPLVPAVAWNLPSWTISVEWFAYLFAFPAGCLLLRKLRLSRPVRLAGLYVVIVAAEALFASGIFRSNSAVIAQGCLLLGAGMLLHSCARETPPNPRTRLWMPAALLACGPIFALAGHWTSYHLFVLLCPLILLACLDPGSLVARVCTWPAMVFLGELSYSLYLNHAVVEKIIDAALPPGSLVNASAGAKAGEVLLYFGGTFALSLFTWQAVEKPARRLLRARFG